MGCSRTFVRLLQISMPLEPGFSGILRSVAGMFYDPPMTEMQLRARAQHRAPSTIKLTEQPLAISGPIISSLRAKFPGVKRRNSGLMINRLSSTSNLSGLFTSCYSTPPLR